MQTTGSKLTPKLIGALAEAYNSGKTTTELAVEFDLSKATICRALRKVGIDPVRKDNLFTEKDVTEEQIKSIIEDFNNKLSIKAICRKYGYSYGLIVKILGDSGLWEAKPAKPIVSKETKIIQMDGATKKILGNQEQNELCEKYVNGPDTKQDLATEYEINIDTVSSILRRKEATVKRYILPETREQIFEEFKKGMSTVSELSTIFQINPETIKYWLKRENLLPEDFEEDIKEDLPAPALRKLARQRSMKALETLEVMLDNPEIPPRDRIAAAKLLFERGYGRPKEEPEEEKNPGESAADRILKLIKK